MQKIAIMLILIITKYIIEIIKRNKRKTYLFTI